MIKFRHNIKLIWDDCKNDPEFMPNYEIRESVYNKNILVANDIKSLDKADQLHYIHNQEFYVIVKYLPDLKYLGAPLKSIKDAYALGYVHPNPYWVSFLRDLRKYIGYPMKNETDLITRYIQEDNLPKYSSEYLKGLYDK